MKNEIQECGGIQNIANAFSSKKQMLMSQVDIILFWRKNCDKIWNFVRF